MTPASDDIHSLESWLREKALEAHNKRAKFELKGLFFDAAYEHGKERAYNLAIAKIQNMRVSQRPHVHGKV